MKKFSKFLFLAILSLSLTSCSIELPSSTIEGIPGEVYSSILVCLIGVVLFLIIFILAKRADPLKKPKGLLSLAEIAVTKIDEMVHELKKIYNCSLVKDFDFLIVKNHIRKIKFVFF